MLGLPARLGGLGIVNPTTLTNEYAISQKICALLVALIVQQEQKVDGMPSTQKELKLSAQREKAAQLTVVAAELQEKLPQELQRAVKMATEKGASTCLTALPIADHDFNLSKAAFRDALSFRYGWTPQCLPSHCSCGESFTVDHALSCPRGGFPTIRHNELRDMCAELLSETCHDVYVNQVYNLFQVSNYLQHPRLLAMMPIQILWQAVSGVVDLSAHFLM